MTEFERTRITFNDALVMLQGWLGKRLTVYIHFGHYVGGASFEARLERVCPVDSPRAEVYLHFENESAYADLSPHMRAFRIHHPWTGTHSLDFRIGDDRILTIEPAACEDLDTNDSLVD